MKILNTAYFIFIVAEILLLSACSAKKDNSPTTAGTAYFGEKPPGLTPKLFDPEIVSPEGLFEGGSFSPDMKEYYFSRKNGDYKERTFFVIRYENGRWGNEAETNIKWPSFSEDGTMMYGGKWYRERTDSGWSERKNQGAFLKEQAHGISLSSKGTYYFGFNEKEGQGYGSIRYSRLIDGKYENPLKMSTEINTGRWIAHPYIAPDESYLMWDVVREDGYGEADIYISFRSKDGSWMPAMNMGDAINTELQESSPSVTYDGKYLFFSRGEWKPKEDGSTTWVGKSYWVDAQIIENLRAISESNFSFPHLEGPYLGQRPPGLVPELFAPDIIQTKHREAEAAFTPDLKEFYFRRRGGSYKNNTLFVIQYKNNRWTESVVPPRAGEPFISLDGKVLHLGNKYRDRTNFGWSEVKNLEAPLNDIRIMRLTASSKGTYYFDEPTGADPIRYSRIIDGKHEKPRTLNVDLGKWNAHPFIAPDESYLIWDDQRESGYGNADLYISFRQQDGSWGIAMNLGGKINTEFGEAYGSVSPDGKYFFFHRGFGGDTGDIYWVNASFIETLRPQ